MPTFRQRITAALSAWKSGSAPAPRRDPRASAMRATRTGNTGSRVPALSARNYTGAQYDRLTEDFLSPLTTGDAEMRTRIRTLRGRARELERNEPYSRRFLSRLEDNVYDHHGMTFSSTAGEWRNGPNGLLYNLDLRDAKVIERAYAEWKKNPFVTGDMTMNEGGRLSLRSTARDGDCAIKRIISPTMNKFGFALQLLEADMIDDQKNSLERPINGRVTTQVRLGVEVNPFYRAIGYWILKEHPGDQQWWNAEGYWSELHEASEFIHPFAKTRMTQVRDVTWLCGIMRDLKMLDGYDEAAIVAARTGAAKMGFLTRGYNEAGPAYNGEEGFDAAEGGDKAMDAEPGLIEDLSQSPGLKFEKWDPAYPHEQYDSFVKTRLRRIGAGLDMSYYAIANDLTEVNFSSIRAGILEDRERYKARQTWWINRFESPAFLWWLEVALLTGSIKDPVTGFSLPFSKLDKFSEHSFRPRRWPWVDPEKDVNASKIAVDNRFKSRSAVIEETSQDTFENVINEQAAEQEVADEAGVELPKPDGAVAEPTTSEEVSATPPKKKQG